MFCGLANPDPDHHLATPDRASLHVPYAVILPALRCGMQKSQRVFFVPPTGQDHTKHSGSTIVDENQDKHDWEMVLLFIILCLSRAPKLRKPTTRVPLDPIRAAGSFRRPYQLWSLHREIRRFGTIGMRFCQEGAPLSRVMWLPSLKWGLGGGGGPLDKTGGFLSQGGSAYLIATHGF